MAVQGVKGNRRFLKKFAYTIEIAGVAHAGFVTMSGLEAAVEEVAHREGGSLIPDKQPGLVNFPDLTLTRGQTFDDEDLYNWLQEVIDSAAMKAEPDQKRSFDVVHRDRQGNELRRWTVVGAWVKNYKPHNGLDANANENAMEEVILGYDFFTKGGDVSP